MGFEHGRYRALLMMNSWNQIGIFVDVQRIWIWISSVISSRSQRAIEKNQRTQPTYLAYPILNLSSGSLELSRGKGIDFFPSMVATVLAPKSTLG